MEEVTSSSSEENRKSSSSLISSAELVSSSFVISSSTSEGISNNYEGLCEGKTEFKAGVNYSSEGYEAIWSGSLWTCRSVAHFCQVGQGHNPKSYSWTNLGKCE